MRIIDSILPIPKDFSNDEGTILRRNLNNHIMDGSMYVFGMSVVAAQTIIPVFIKELGGGPLAIGSVQVIWTIGTNIPGAFVAYYLQQKEYFKPIMVKYGFVHRFLLFVCAIAAVTLVGRFRPSVTVPIFLMLIFLVAAFASIGGLPWFQVYTKTVPVRLRGRLMGIRQLIGSVEGIIGGAIVSFILATVVFPLNYSILFLIAFFLTMVSLYFLSKVREAPTPVSSDAAPLSIIREAKKIIRSNRNYRHYLVGDIFVLMTFGSISFYSVYGIEKFSLPASFVGTFTAVMMVSNIVSNIVFGFIADAYGHRINMIFLVGCMAMASLTAVLSPNVLMYGFVFVFISCALQILNISRLPLIAEMCEERERPTYIGVTNSITAPALLVGVIFGWIVREGGYISIFLVTDVIAVIAFYILTKYVVEPRHIKIR